jgi:hypothetical protein
VAVSYFVVQFLDKATIFKNHQVRMEDCCITFAEALSDAFLAVQRRFVERQRRGALLCLVSRNVEEDVRAARLELHCLELLFLDLSPTFPGADPAGAARAARQHVLVQGERFTDLISMVNQRNLQPSDN